MNIPPPQENPPPLSAETVAELRELLKSNQLPHVSTPVRIEASIVAIRDSIFRAWQSRDLKNGTQVTAGGTRDVGYLFVVGPTGQDVASMLVRGISKLLDDPAAVLALTALGHSDSEQGKKVSPPPRRNSLMELKAA